MGTLRQGKPRRVWVCHGHVLFMGQAPKCSSTLTRISFTWILHPWLSKDRFNTCTMPELEPKELSASGLQNSATARAIYPIMAFILYKHFPTPIFLFSQSLLHLFLSSVLFPLQISAKQFCSLSGAELSLQVLSNSNPFALTPLCLAQKSAFSPTILCW